MYRFDAPRNIDSATVYWVDDTDRGQCRVPKNWQLFWLDGSDWKLVELHTGEGHGTESNACIRDSGDRSAATGMSLPIVRLEYESNAEERLLFVLSASQGRRDFILVLQVGVGLTCFAGLGESLADLLK